MKLINMTTLDGVKLNTKNKYCDDDIQVQVSSDLEYKGEIESGGVVKKRSLKKLLDYTKSCKNMFSSNNNITNLTGYLEYSDTENVTNMYGTFYACSNLTTIPPLDTSKVTNFISTFQECSKLTTIPPLDTSKATDMNNIFYFCRVLEKIDISYYNISISSNSSRLCAACYSLKEIIIRGFGKTSLSSNAFELCYHLTGTTNSTYNPNGDKDGYIYVPRNMVDKLKSATNWSVYADQIRALEDYTVDGTTTGELDESKI